MSLIVLTGVALSGALLAGERAQGQTASAASVPDGAVVAPRLQQPTIAQALESGVLIVISKASQQMHVFKDGQPWLSSPVSTGRRGHGTPAGVFPILGKQKYHRSNLYSNAPMPFMQRLTMGGIAIHAGHLPGYPASHGCIRVPYAFARSLFGLTRPGDTTVVIMNEAMQSDEQARSLALTIQQPQRGQQPQPGQPAPIRMARVAVPLPNAASPPPTVLLAQVQPPPPPRPSAGPAQTIQLAAAVSPHDAEDRWRRLISLHADLARFDKTVVPVAIGSHRYFRLRATGPGAHLYCSTLKSAGLDCFNVL